jgi:hypothetical protein
MKEYFRAIEFHKKRRDFVFTLQYDDSGKRTLIALVVAYSDDAPPTQIRVSAEILESWGMDLTDWADNLESLSDHAMSAVDGVSEK